MSGSLGMKDGYSVVLEHCWMFPHKTSTFERLVSHWHVSVLLVWLGSNELLWDHDSVEWTAHVFARVHDARG